MQIFPQLFSEYFYQHDKYNEYQHDKCNWNEYVDEYNTKHTKKNTLE